MSGPSRDLAALQRWMQSVVTHPLGPDEGIRSRAAQEELPVKSTEIESVILPSSRLSATERLNVYASAYYARLFECLRSEFPMLLKALGQEIFDEFAFNYLQRYPSTSYTLGQLGRNFVRFLEETRPRPTEDEESGAAQGSASQDWMNLLIDVARLEWAIGEVFDGPGSEGQPLLSPERLQSVSPSAWPEARLLTAPSLRLIESAFPLNDYYVALRRGEEPSTPPPSRTYLALSRRDYVVRRHPLREPEYRLLAALESGESVGSAISKVTECESVDLEELALQLQQWFRRWTREGFFAGIELQPG